MDFCASGLKIGRGMTATTDPPLPVTGDVVQPERVMEDAELARMAFCRQVQVARATKCIDRKSLASAPKLVASHAQLA